MKLFKRDIPPRAAIAVVGLVLIASIVNGREQEPEAPAPVTRAAQGAAPADTLANLDIEKLKRTAQPEGVTDVLAHRSLLPAAAPGGQNAAEPGEAAAAPAAPALPFSYLGRLVDSGATTIFVGRGAEHYILEPGMKIDASYQVERITDKQVTFVYLPLGTRQTLAVPSIDE